MSVVYRSVKLDTLTGERQAARRDEDAVGGHRAFNLEQPTETTGDTRARLEHGPGPGSRRKLERPDRCHPELYRRARFACRGRRDGDPPRLREQLDEDHRGHDRPPWKMSLEIEVVGMGTPPPHRAPAVLELDDFLEQPHRRLMRQAIDQRHRGLVYFGSDGCFRARCQRDSHALR